jgi:hypothetical protein
MKARPSRPRRSSCFGCGWPVGARSSKYCSQRGQRDTHYRDSIRRWLAGEVSGGSVASVSDHVRRCLLEQGGERCPRCGWPEHHPLTGRVPLEIDHLNGKYADNSPGNVRLLCPNCHALTPTYPALTKGHSRPWAVARRKR